MKKWLALVLFLGVAALPGSARAQYTQPGYYYPPAYQYGTPHAYYQGASYPAPGYYNPQQMPAYVPTHPSYQGMPAYATPTSGWQANAVPQARHVYLQPVAATAPNRAPSTAPAPAARKSAVQQVDKKTVTAPVETATPELIKEPTRVAQPAAEKAVPKTTEVLQTMPVTLSENSDARKCKLMIFGEYLYWNVHGADVPFAQAFDGVDPIFSVPRGPVGVAAPRFQSGFRVGAGAGLGENAWVVATFTYFHTQLTAETAAGDGLVLHNFLAFPNTTNAAVDSLKASADYRIKLLLGDIDGKFAIVNNDCVSLAWVAGARYAHLDQTLLNTFQVIGDTTVDSRINFDGFGPRIGLEGQYRIIGGFYGYANGMANFLFGQFRGSYEEQNVFTGLVGLTTVNANRVVPVLELEIGAGWQSSNGRFRIAGGYYVGSWFNTMTTTSLAGAIGNVNFTTNGNNFRDNIVFDGLVLRGEFRY